MTIGAHPNIRSDACHKYINPTTSAVMQTPSAWKRTENFSPIPAATFSRSLQ